MLKTTLNTSKMYLISPQFGEERTISINLAIVTTMKFKNESMFFAMKIVTGKFCVRNE